MKKWPSIDSARPPAHDVPLALAVLALVLFGLLMVYSASAPYAQKYHGRADHLFLKQLLAAIVGGLLLFSLWRSDYRRLAQMSNALLLAALGLTGLTLLPGWAARGSWLNLFGFAIQPTEFLKAALLVFLAASIARQAEQMQSFVRGLLPLLSVTGLAALLALMQSDFAMAAIYLLLGMTMLYLGGVRCWHLGGVMLAAVPIMVWALVSAPYRRGRLLAFLAPFQYGTDEGYQLIQSLTALGSGGLLGRGLGESRGKLLYLPAAYNDFIFSIIGEELGLLGTFCILGWFVYLALRGVMITLATRERFGMMLAGGATFLLCAQASINVGVAAGMLPVTGLTLPFVSYGGSSMVVSLGLVGMLLSVARHNQEGSSERLGIGRRDGWAFLSRPGAAGGPAGARYARRVRGHASRP